jgi:hypothetical protein
MQTVKVNCLQLTVYSNCKAAKVSGRHSPYAEKAMFCDWRDHLSQIVAATEKNVRITASSITNPCDSSTRLSGLQSERNHMHGHALSLAQFSVPAAQGAARVELDPRR